jgi:hypothetical protein
MEHIASVAADTATRLHTTVVLSADTTCSKRCWLCELTMLVELLRAGMYLEARIMPNILRANYLLVKRYIRRAILQHTIMRSGVLPDTFCNAARAGAQLHCICCTRA